MRRVLLVVAVVVLLAPGLALAQQSRTYDKGLETVWDHAVKAARDVNFVVVDSNREDHVLIIRTTSKLSHKRGLEMRVGLQGDLERTAVTVSAVDPSRRDKAQKHIAKYLEQLDRRLE